MVYSISALSSMSSSVADTFVTGVPEGRFSSSDPSKLGAVNWGTLSLTSAISMVTGTLEDNGGDPESVTLTTNS